MAQQAKKTTTTEKSAASPKTAASKAPAKKKPAARKATSKKATVKPAAKKAAPKKKAAQKAAPKKTTAKKSATRKAASKKPETKKSPVKKKATTKRAVKARATSAKRKKTATPAKRPATRAAAPENVVAAPVQAIAQAMLSPKPNLKMESIMTQSKSQMEKMAQDAATLGRDNVEAFVKSGTIFAKGFEEIMRTSVTMAQSTAEKQAQLMKEAMSCKTLNEWTEAQNKLAQTNMDDIMSSANKISEMSAKVLTESVEPINKQMDKAIKKASTAMAA